MPVLKESYVERAVCRRARKELGLTNIKLKANGWPDRQFFIPGGRPMFIEFKVPGQHPTPLQAYIHDLLRSLKYDVVVCTTIAVALSTLTSAMETARLHAQRCHVSARARVRRSLS